MGTGVEEAAIAESVKGAGEAAAAEAAGGSALGGFGDLAALDTATAAGASSAAGAAGAAGAAPYASALGAGAGDAAMYALPGSGGAQFAGMSLADLGGVSASLTAADLAAGSAAGAAGGGGAAGGEAGLAPASSGAPPSSIPTGGAGDLSGAGLPDPTGTLPDVAGSTAPPTGSPVDVMPNGNPTDMRLAEGIQAPPSAAPPAGVTGNSSIDKALKALGIDSGKGALSALNTGLAGASVVKQLGAGNQAQGQFSKIAGPANEAAQKLLAQFQSGQLSAADSFAIAQMTQQQKASVNQYYAKAGLSNSSMHQQALQQIDTQAEAMRSQQVQNLLKQGLSAAGVANPLLSQGVTAGLNSDAAAMKAMQEFISTMSKMNNPQPAAQTGTPG